jgi:hypothetical protein
MHPFPSFPFLSLQRYLSCLGMRIYLSYLLFLIDCLDKGAPDGDRGGHITSAKHISTVTALLTLSFDASQFRTLHTITYSTSTINTPFSRDILENWIGGEHANEKSW